ARDRVARLGKRPCAVQLDQATRGRDEAGGAAQADAALEARRTHGDGPTAPLLAEGVGHRYPCLLQEDLREAGLAVELRDGAHRDALRVEGHEDEREAAMALGLRIGAEDPEHPVGERAARAPRLPAD